MFSEDVRAHRRRLGMSQEDLADRAGVNVRSIRKIERGLTSAPRLVTVRLLADAFGLDGAEREKFYLTALQNAQARPAPKLPVPAQLPADISGFTGREHELHRLTALLDGNGGARAATAVVVAIAGTAGVGKTALAVHWGHRVRPRFPDGQLYVNLRGFDPAGAVTSASAAVRGFLEALGVTAQQIPAELDAQAGLYRSLLADRRTLVVLDNARDADQVRPLLPGAPGCLVLVTSRNQLSGLVTKEGAYPLNLDLLSHAEARDLLARRIGTPRVSADPQAVDNIVTGCARLPLALSIAAARAATHPQLPLTDLASHLGQAHGGLDALAGTDPASDARVVFSWSYRALNPPAARLFRLLGLHPGPDWALAAATSLAGIPSRQARALLAELTHAHLATEHTPGRYICHDLLRAYASELTHEMDSAAERRAALCRMLDHYLHSAHAATLVLDPHRHPITLNPAEPGAELVHPPGRTDALAWFTAESPVLLAALDLAVQTGFDTHCWQLAWALADFLEWCGRWQEWQSSQRRALIAAQRAGDQVGQAHAHRNLAATATRQHRFDDAHEHLRRALELTTELGDPIGQAYTHRGMARLLGLRGDYRQALHHAGQALNLYRAASHRVGQARTLNNIGWAHAQLGDYPTAVTHCQQALTLHQQLDDRYGQASTWDSLGYAHQHLGHHAEATTCYQRALDIYRDVGDRYFEAGTLEHLGDMHAVVSNLTAARDNWRHALEIYTDLGHPEADKVLAKLHG